MDHNEIGALLAGLLDNGGKSDDQPVNTGRPLPEAAVETLKDLYQRYTGKHPFKPGDIVTPRKGYGLRGAGHPCIVLEIPKEPIRDMKAETHNMNYGSRLDMRVATIEKGGIVIPFWSESWQYQRWEPKKD